MSKRKGGMCCDSCRRLGGVPRIYGGVQVVMCDECTGSDFRIKRCIERARGGSS